MLNVAELAVVASYGNAITSVEYLDAGYNKTTKQYSESSGKLNMSYEADKELVIFSADSVLKNQTVKGQLLITTEHGEYRSNLNVVIKNKAPTVTVKQSPKFNFFYLDSQNTMTFTVKNELVTGVELVSGDFMGEWDGEQLNISYKSATPPAKPNTKATVLISLEGYEYPVSKAVTISTATTKPSLSLSPASGVLNTAYGEKDMYIDVYNKTAKADLDLSNVEASVSPASAGTVRVENGRLKFTAASGYSGGKLSIRLKDENWLSPISLSFTLKVNSNPVTMKLGSSTLTVDKTFTSAAAVEINASHSNLDTSCISGTPTPVKGSDKLSVWVDSGKVYAKVLDSSIATGSYKLKVTPLVSNGECEAKLNALTLTVKVASNASYSAAVSASGKLDAVQRGSSGITYTLTKLSLKLKVVK